MNIPTAQAYLETIINQKQQELDTFTLSLSVLNTKFAPDLSAITDSQNAADVIRKELDETQQNLVDTRASVDALNAQLETANTTITDLQQQVVDLTKLIPPPTAAEVTL